MFIGIHTPIRNELEKELKVNLLQEFSGGFIIHYNQERKYLFDFQVQKCLPNYAKLILLNRLIQSTSTEAFKQFNMKLGVIN